MTLADAPRTPTHRRYVMCRPEHFEVRYAINVWMDPSRPVNRDLALHQWETLRTTYLDLGHEVDLLDPVPGLPDMVFAANGAFVIDDVALGARFRERVRADEAPAHRRYLASRGIRVHEGRAVNEGEGDFAFAGDVVLAGTGFRSDPAAFAELESVLGRPVVPLELVDPRFYHLDTALVVLAPDVVAYFPEAFAPHSRAELERRYPDAILATERDALALGLNAVSDGRHVVLAAQTIDLPVQVAAAGLTPVPVDVSELKRAGGGVKCATMELHRTVAVPLPTSTPATSTQATSTQATSTPAISTQATSAAARNAGDRERTP